MLRRILLPSIFGILAYGFWVSPDFKEIAAGVAIFLFGMLSLEEGFRAFSGGLLERILHRSTDQLYKSLGFGIVATTLMQSSSLVSVLTISFLSAGMIGLKAGLGIIFGANLGTTTGAWLVAGFGLKVKISAYALPMLPLTLGPALRASAPLRPPFVDESRRRSVQLPRAPGNPRDGSPRHSSPPGPVRRLEFL